MAEKREHKRSKAADDRAASKRAKEMAALYEEIGDNPLSMDALEKIAGKHVDKDTAKLLKKAQSLHAKKQVKLEDMADLAAEFGDKAGLSESQQQLLKALGGELDEDEVAKIPGVVVDKETGTISVLGLINLDATDPTSQLIAKGIAAAYSGIALNVNEIGFKKAYDFSSKQATKFDLTRASNHRIGLAAAAGLVGVTSFWPDINRFIQQEKQDRKDVMGLANQFSTLLDDYGKRGTRVSKLYQIRPEDNEMIYNARRQIGMEHNAERFRQVVDLSIGRVPLFLASIKRGHAEVGGLQQEASAAAEIASKQLKGEAKEDAMLRAIGERADKIVEMTKVSREKAVEMATKQVETGSLSAAETGDKKMGFWNQMGRDGVNGGIILAPVLADMVSRNLFNQRLKDRGVQPISATDMVFHLREQINDDPKANSFSLPKGMTIEGSRGSNNQVRLEEYVEQVFEQHERDCAGNNAKIPARYDDELHAASKLIASALRDGRLDGIALVKLVGERKIVRPAGKTVAPEEIVNAEIDRLEEQMRHVEFTDNKRYFEESSFTPEELKASWDGMDQDERAVFAQMVPPTVLESVGVNNKELDALRQQREQHFYDDLHQLVQGLLSLGDDVLQELGVTRTETQMFQKLDKVASEKGGAAAGQEMKKDINQLTHAVANSLVAHQRQHEGRIQELIERQHTQ